MWDKRVFRGNTYASQVLPPSAQAEAERQAADRAATRRRRTQQKHRQARASQRPRTPPPVDGRVHADVQTETYLEALEDELPHEEAATQTDALLDRPPSPLFVPAKTGKDKHTQIEEGELFDFDLEVEPILEVLVGKTLEQGLMEVLEEEELAAIRRHQEEFEQIRDAELAEVQRMESEARRKNEEKQRRLEQERQRVRREAAVREKVAASAFARRYLNSVRDSVFARLVQEGHFYDPVAKEVEEEFLPEVLQAAVNRLADMGLARDLTDMVLGGALELGQRRQHDELERRRKAEEERLAREEAERQAREEEARRKAEEEEARRLAEEAENEEDEEDE